MYTFGWQSSSRRPEEGPTPEEVGVVLDGGLVSWPKAGMFGKGYRYVFILSNNTWNLVIKIEI